MSDDRYARIYFDRIERDPKFEGIRNDRAKYGSWVMLLQEAEKAWPSPAFLLPSSWVPRAHVELFAARQIIDLTSDGRFEMHGLDAIRAERSKRASDAANKRWGNAGSNASGNANASATSMPRRDETRQAETRRDDARAAAIDMHTREGLLHVTPLVAEAWQDATGLTLLGSGAFAQDRIDDACRRHPESRVIAAIQSARDGFTHIPDAAALVVAVRNQLDPLPSGKASKQQDTERREAERSRRAVQATKKRIHDLGHHADERDPACDACKGGKAA